MRSPGSKFALVAALAAATLVGSVTLPAFAGPRDRRENRQERREERRDNRQDRRDDRAGDRQERRVQRSARRADQREALRKKWGAALDRPLVKAELRSHARRAARIERIHQLADENGNAKLSATATSLLETEQQRHQRRMEALTTAGSK